MRWWMGCVLVGGLTGGLIGCSFDAGSTSDTDVDMIGGDQGSADSGTTTSTTGPGNEVTTAPVTTVATSAAATTEPTGNSPTSTTDEPNDTTTDGSDTQPETGTDASSSGEEGPLADEGVVVRYFLDEAPSGTSPILAIDSTDDPFDLPIDYVGDGLNYTAVGGNRGLQWSAIGLDAGPRAAVAGSELDGLAGVTSVTFEVVIQAEEFISQSSRIVHVGEGNGSGLLTLSSGAADELEFSWGDTVVRTWVIPGLISTRHVVHVVVDTDAPNEMDRIRLVLDGIEVGPDSSTDIDQGETVDLGQDPIFALGNRDMERSFRGILFYAAIYAGALDDNAIAQNVAALMLSDDG